MSVQDMFLDMLTEAPTARRTVRATTPPPPPSARPARTVAAAKAAPAPTKARPEWADEIDRMVKGLVDAGDVVFDSSADSYRRPWCRRYRFGE